MKWAMVPGVHIYSCELQEDQNCATSTSARSCATRDNGTYRKSLKFITPTQRVISHTATTPHAEHSTSKASYGICLVKMFASISLVEQHSSCISEFCNCS